jgi:hypothetical protein
MSSGPEPNQVTVYYRCFSCLSCLLIWVNKTVFNSGPDDSSSTCHNFRATTTIVCVQSSEMKRKRPGPWFSRFRVRGVLIHQFINGRFAVGDGVWSETIFFPEYSGLTWMKLRFVIAQILKWQRRKARLQKNVLAFSHPGYNASEGLHLGSTDSTTKRLSRIILDAKILLHPNIPAKEKDYASTSLHWPKCWNRRFRRPGLLVSTNLWALPVLGAGPVTLGSYYTDRHYRASSDTLRTCSGAGAGLGFPAVW